MNRYSHATPCPAPVALPQQSHLSAFGANNTTAAYPDDTTTNLEYTTELKQRHLNAKPRRRATVHKKTATWDPSTDIWADDAPPEQPQHRRRAAAENVTEAPAAAARSRGLRQSTILAQPAQRIQVPPVPVKEEEVARPRRRRVSALLAEKVLGNTPKVGADSAPAEAEQKRKKAAIQKDPRRRTIYVPSDDTTIMTIHPGMPMNGRRVKSPDLGFDLVTLSEEEPGQPPPAIKQKPALRKSLAAAPKRGPLQQSSRPLQAVSFVEDIIGKSLGKENIPPGKYSGTEGTSLRKTSRASHGLKETNKLPARPDMAGGERASATAPTSASTARAEMARKRTGSDSMHKDSPSKLQKSSRHTAAARVPLRDSTTKRQLRSSSNHSSPFHMSKSPPQALRRHRDKPPSKLSVPLIVQKARERERKYPVISEDLDRPELYEDSWLGYQEVAITQLVNKLFDSVDLTSQDADQEDGSLRRKLLSIYHEPYIPLLHKRLQASLLYGALTLPKDLLVKALRLKDDVGLRRKYLNLFVNTYDLSVLRAAAETIVGREIPLSSRLSSGSTSSDSDQRQKRAEKKAIEGFLDTFLIRNEDAVRVKTGPGSIVSIARGRDNYDDDFGSQGCSWRRTVLRSLMLVLLLDMTKTRDIINIPLFQVSSPHKSSSSILQELGGMLLPSLGDLSRTLGHFDYHLRCVQYPLQEFKYRIENLATDLRDGVLLTRLVELLLYSPATLALQKDNFTITMPTGEILTSVSNLEDKDAWVLSQHLKFPCLGRAQKMYNVQVALSALEGVRDVAARAIEEITAEDVVNGHREKTLGLLWSLVGKWGLEALVDWGDVEKEIQRYRKAFYDQQSDDEYQDPDSDDETELAELEGLEKFTCLLRTWARNIARLRGLRVANLTTSFSDDRILETIVDEYIPCFPASVTATLTSSKNTPASLPAKLKSIGCSTSFISLFAPFSASTRPIPSKDFTITTLTFLASRLLPASGAYRAALAIQRWYRARLARREASKRVALMRLAAHCAAVVQTRERVVGAAVVLQRAWRQVLDVRIGKLVGDVVAFQALARGWAVRRKMGAKGGVKRRERVRGGW